MGSTREALGAFGEEERTTGNVHLVTAAVTPQAAAGNDAFWLAGKATARRLRRWKFPVFELEQDGNVLAQMGRTGWFKVYLGSGQRIDIPNEDRWTIRSIAVGGTFSPIIVDSSGRKVALAGMSHGSYGINGKDYSCVLAPVDQPMVGRANTWNLRRFEDNLATITRYPLSVDASHPVHLGAVLMSFVLVRYGLPEESMPRIPAFRW